MLNHFMGSHPVRGLAVFGIVLPLGIVLVCDAFLKLKSGDQNLLKWLTIIAGFWFIAGMLATGVAIIRDALRRDA